MDKKINKILIIVLVIIFSLLFIRHYSWDYVNFAIEILLCAWIYKILPANKITNRIIALVLIIAIIFSFAHLTTHIRFDYLKTIQYGDLNFFNDATSGFFIILLSVGLLAIILEDKVKKSFRKLRYRD